MRSAICALSFFFEKSRASADALSAIVYTSIFQRTDGEALLMDQELRRIVSSIDRKEIVKWIS